MNIKKLMLGLSFLVMALLAITFYSVSAKADDSHENRNHENRNNHSNFNADTELTRAKCNATRDPVIDVTQRVKHDVDNGFGANAYFTGEANYWNVENYNRRIRVWAPTENIWCAVVTYENGNFNAFYRQTGPGGTGLIGGGDVTGNMHGGYRSTVFTGTLTPTWPTHGNVGTFDYDCDLHGVCGPNRVDWLSKYFPDAAGFDLAWWGWIYQADGHHGTWINAIDVLQADSGNIL